MLSFSLKDCGHTFCAGCILLLLRANLCDHIHRLESACPIPTGEVMTENEIPWIKTCICRMISNQLPLPEYRCPKCRGNISSKPVAAFLVEEILDEVNKSSQQLMPGVVRPTCRQRIEVDVDVDIAWDAFFTTQH